MSDNLVTIFGASGFLGRYAVRRFAKAGFRVRAAVRRPNGAHFLKTMGVVGQIEVRQTNVRRSASIAKAVEGADVVVNLVGILSPSGAQTFESLHAEAPGLIAAAAAQAGAKRFVHVSAIGARMDSPSSYARSKADGERRAREAFAGTITLRPSIVVGAEDEFFNRFAALARLSPVLPLFGGGKTRFQPVFVGDVAEAIFAAATGQGRPGESYELGGPGILTFRELMEEMLRVTEMKRLLLPLPFVAAQAIAVAGWLVPDFLMKPIITLDQVKLLREDNVVSTGARTFADLGLAPQAIEPVLPTYLHRYRRTGQFASAAA